MQSSDTNPLIEKKYYNLLLNNLVNNKILNKNDIDNINIKLESKLFTMADIITSLEKMNNNTIVENTSKQFKSDVMYTELLPSQITPIGTDVSSSWSDNYSILNTDKWKVPLSQPPICINTSPCKVCPDDESSYPYLGLINWDNNKISTTTINNDWGRNQTDSSIKLNT
jgi:hypothetical protein